jgi:hypothetical protein
MYGVAHGRSVILDGSWRSSRRVAGARCAGLSASGGQNSRAGVQIAELDSEGEPMLRVEAKGAPSQRSARTW